MAVKKNQIKSALWDAADTLRGSAVDRTDWKGYILPLLFVKRVSDVWDEETAAAAGMYGDADPPRFAEVHRFSGPEGAIGIMVDGQPPRCGSRFCAQWKL